MGKNNCIAIIDTIEHDIFSNPTMVSIIKSFQEKGISILLFTSNKNIQIPQDIVCLKISQSPSHSHLIPKKPWLLWPFIQSYLVAKRNLKREKIITVLCIDPHSLMVAGRIKRIYKCIEIHYLSFEIFFMDEMIVYALDKIKKDEIKYSKYIHSVVIQDKYRAEKLKTENKNIPINAKWFYIPVAPRTNEMFSTNNFTREMFGISVKDKILITSGDVLEHNGIKIIIQALQKGLPTGYKILIHCRYKFNQDLELHQILIDMEKDGYPLILHDARFETYNEYCNFVKLFDYCIAFYVPHSGSHYTGKNLENIGLSSGKFSTYMMIGKPTLVTSQKVYEELNNKYHFGAIVNNADDIVDILSSNELDKVSIENCRTLYNDVLNPIVPIENYTEYIYNRLEN